MPACPHGGPAQPPGRCAGRGAGAVRALLRDPDRPRAAQHEPVARGRGRAGAAVRAAAGRGRRRGAERHRRGGRCGARAAGGACACRLAPQEPCMPAFVRVHRSGQAGPEPHGPLWVRHSAHLLADSLLRWAPRPTLTLSGGGCARAPSDLRLTRRCARASRAPRGAAGPAGAQAGGRGRGRPPRAALCARGRAGRPGVRALARLPSSTMSCCLPAAPCATAGRRCNVQQRAGITPGSSALLIPLAGLRSGRACMRLARRSQGGGVP